MESLFVQIKQKRLPVKEIVIGVIYRPPNTDPKKFSDIFSPILQRLNHEKRPTYLLGDFNFDLLKYEKDSNTQSFLNLLFENGFCPKIDRPTHTEFSATLIDNIFTNVPLDDAESGPIIMDISDHLPVYITLPYETERVTRDKPKFINKRFYDENKLQNFKADLAQTDWASTISILDASDKYHDFCEKINALHNKHFPLTQIKLNANNVYKPWITSTI